MTSGTLRKIRSLVVCNIENYFFVNFNVSAVTDRLLPDLSQPYRQVPLSSSQPRYCENSSDSH